MDSFNVEATFPPSLQDNPVLAMLTIMAFWAAVMICLGWLWEIVASNRDEPAPKGSYIRVARRMRFWLLLSVLVVSIPRLAQLAIWQLLTVSQRETVSTLAWLVRIPGDGMIIFAWWLDRRLTQTESDYVAEKGFYPASAIPRHEKKRGAIILTLIFVVSFATTFIRPDRNDAGSFAIVQAR